MTDLTPLDAAHAAMQSDEQDATARLAFYGQFAEAELMLLLNEEPSGASLTPRLFPVEGQNFVMVFDTDERLSTFANSTEGTVPYAAISGRALIGMLAGKDVGLGLNLGVAPSGFLMPATTVVWLSELLNQSTDAVLTRPKNVHAPVHVSDTLRDALTRKLALAGALAGAAYLVRAEFDGATDGLLLAIIDAVPEAEKALTQAISEAMIFAGENAAGLSVVFLAGSDQMAGRISEVGYPFEMPEPQEKVHSPKAPGMDPDSPPRL